MNGPAHVARVRLLALSLVFASASACGNGPEFTPVPVCPALPTATAALDSVLVQGAQGTVYASTLYAGLATLSNLTNDFRARWTANEPVESASFRSAFADYSGRVICAARALRDLPAPDATYARFHVAFSRAMDQQVATAQLGRTAVQQRNVTQYHRWIAQQQAMPALIRDAFTLLP